MNPPTILIAGGGTGGHVFPGLAVADALVALSNVRVVFCGTARGIEQRVVPRRGYRLERLAVEPIQGGGVRRAIRGSLVAAAATFAARRLVANLSPRAALSVGGYASGPVSLAAAACSVPLAVLEPNSVIGLANRALGPFAKRAYVAWDEVAPAFRAGIARRTGVPLRRGFAPAEYPGRDRMRVLVLGGSQGASALNERLPDAIAVLAARGRHVDVLHQTGTAGEHAVRAAYAHAELPSARTVSFIDDVASALVDADVLVARAGAVTLAEITAVGRPAILVPFPFAADDHQRRNAQALARAGAAICIDQSAATPERLARELERLAVDRRGRFAMAEASRALGRPNAAEDVASDLLALASIAPGDRGRVRESHRIMQLLCKSDESDGGFHFERSLGAGIE